jgi:AcrR family transcriptional regulator
LKARRKLKANHEIRDRITGAALELFLQAGFSKVTMDELASNLGMSKKTIYGYFPSKDALVQELVEKTLKTIEAGVDRIVFSRRLDFVEKLKQLLGFIGAMIGNFGPAFSADLHKHAPGVWKEIDEFRRKKIIRNFGRLFEEGIKKGVFRKDINPELLVRMYANTVSVTLNPATLSELPVSATDIFDAIVKVFFEGILTGRARATHYRSGVIPAIKKEKKK